MSSMMEFLIDGVAVKTDISDITEKEAEQYVKIVKLKNYDSQVKALRILKALAGKNAREIVEGVIADVKRHTAGAAQSDDITMLCIRWQEK